MVEYNGRKIDVYRFRENPLNIYIDVMQKEGDCPKGYSRDKRLSCPLDCQDTFLTFVYGVMERKIVTEGALMNKGEWVYNRDAMLKHGFDPRTMRAEDFVKANFDGIVFVKNDIGESLVFEGDGLCFKPVCGFQVMDFYNCPDPEVREYQELIRRMPIEVMKKGGIEFHGTDGSIITFGSQENVRSQK